MKQRITIIIISLFFIATYSYSQSGSTGYGYAYPDSIEIIEAIEAIDSLDYVDYSLYGIIKNRDWDRLVLDREQALSVLDHLSQTAYGIHEQLMVKKLLTSKALNISNQELLTYKRVRSIQVNDMGIFSYPYFSCRFRRKNGKLFFEKTSGSQRKSGFIYDNKPNSKVFLGGWSVNDDPQTTYESENSVPGMLYKIGASKIIMVFLSQDEQSFEIYELTK